MTADDVEAAGTSCEVPQQFPLFPFVPWQNEEALSELEKVIGNEGRALVQLRGPLEPGVSLAASWAARYLDRFSDGRLYVDLYARYKPTVTLDQVLCRWLTALGQPPDIAMRDEIRPLFDAYQDLTAGRRLLVVIHDPRSSAQLRTLAPLVSEHSVTLAISPYGLTAMPENEGWKQYRVPAEEP